MVLLLVLFAVQMTQPSDFNVVVKNYIMCFNSFKLLRNKKN